MRRNVHSLRIAASVFFLLLMISVQAGKLFHASQHATHSNSAAHSVPLEKDHSASFTKTACAACEFEYCREAVAVDAILLKEIAVHAASPIVPPAVTVSLLRFRNADWRGPPSC